MWVPWGKTELTNTLHINSKNESVISSEELLKVLGNLENSDNGFTSCVCFFGSDERIVCVCCSEGFCKRCWNNNHNKEFKCLEFIEKNPPHIIEENKKLLFGIEQRKLAMRGKFLNWSKF